MSDARVRWSWCDHHHHHNAFFVVFAFIVIVAFIVSELRAAAYQCVYDAMVPDALFHVPAERNGAPGLGPHLARGQRGAAEDSTRHMERPGGVSSGASGGGGQHT